MTGPDAIALAQHQQARQFDAAGTDLLQELYSHLACEACRNRIDDPVAAEHVTKARDLALIAMRAQRAISNDNTDQYEVRLDAVRFTIGQSI